MKLNEIRKKLHSLAETAHREKKTAQFVAKYLQKAGATTLWEGVGGYGIVAVWDSGNDGPSVLFRAELDALPIDETIDLPYASKQKGVSHKCGHDGHMATLLGLADQLKKKPIRSGKVYLLFQPAEETGEGASLMLKDERWPDIAPDHVFALHNLPGFPKNSVVLRDEIFAAGSQGLIIRLTGNTSHAAHPENARSPASAIATLINDLQNLPRTVIPFDRAGLLTIIHARIGEPAFGTTPGYAELMATLRAHQSEDLQMLGEKAVSQAEAVASQWDLSMEYEWTEIFKPVCNHKKSVALVEDVAQKLVGDENKKDSIKIRHIPRPFSWSEDFGHFTERYTGALFGIGAGTDHPQLHDGRYDYPDELIETGCLLFSGIIDYLQMR